MAMLHDPARERRHRRAPTPMGAFLGAAFALLSAGACDLERPAAAVEGVATETYEIRQRVNMRLRRRSGDDAVRIGMDAVASVQRVTADSMHAWIDEATGFMAMGNRRMEGEPRFLVRRPFVLVRDDDGHFRSVERPAVPDDLPASQDFLRGLVDMFENFYPPYPEDSLRVGMAWADTFAFDRSDRRGVRSYVTVANVRVARDTTADGRRALVLEGEGETVRADAPEEDLQRGTTVEVVFPDGTPWESRTSFEGVLRGESAGRFLAGVDSADFDATTTVVRLRP
jgi:hypothetical protein